MEDLFDIPVPHTSNPDTARLMGFRGYWFHRIFIPNLYIESHQVVYCRSLTALEKLVAYWNNGTQWGYIAGGEARA